MVRILRTRTRRLRGLAPALLLALAVATLGSGVAFAQQGAAEPGSSGPAAAADPNRLEGWAYTLANEMWSPFCPGRTLSDCPSPNAADLRMWIITQEAAGATREEVETTLMARYGEDIWTTPKVEGWGLAAYLIPLVGFLLGGGVVVVFLRHQARLQAQARAGGPPEASTRVAPAGPAGALASSDPELERLVDEEIARS